MATMNSSLAPIKVSVSDRHKVVAASFVGNFVEWFDYASYGYLATMIAAAFFPTRNPTAGLLATFGVFAISFASARSAAWCGDGSATGWAARPRWHCRSLSCRDRPPRSRSCRPTARWGLAAPLLLLVVRMVQGFSASGEYAGASTFLAEYAPNRRRGLQVSVVPASTAAGLLFGSLLATLLTGTLSKPELASVGWRLPFLLALPLGMIGWYIRNRLEDTPVFRSLEPTEHAAAPVRETLVRNRKAIGLAFGATLLNAVGFYLVLSYMPTYLSTQAHLGSTASFVAITVSLITYIFFIFAAGALSDRFGRKTMLIAASVCFMALTVPLFALLDQVSFTGIVFIGVILGAMLTMNDGTLATYLTEVFPTRVRYTGFAFSFNAANALFGGTAPFVATLLISLTGSKLAPAWYLVAAATVTLAAMLASKETAGKPLQ